MRVKLFDESHERDLEISLNKFLSTVQLVVDIKYNVSVVINGEEQIYCFSAMVIYEDWV